MSGRLGPGLVVLCLWLGLVAVQRLAGDPLVITAIQPNHYPAEGIKNVQITVTFTGAPQDLDPTGALRFIPKDGSAENDLLGTYTVENGTLTATLKTERGWKTISYQSVIVEPSGLELQISEPVDVDAIQPKSMNVAPDPALTTDDVLAFLAHITEVPSKGVASDCQQRLYFVQRKTSEPVELKPREALQLSGQDNKPSIIFQLDRPSRAQPILDAVLELCEGADRWIYRGGPVEAIPLQQLEIHPEDRKGAEQKLWLKVFSSPDDPAQRLDAEIINGADSISGLRKGKQITFQRQGDSYSAEILVTCSSQEIELPELRVTARDDKSRQYLLKSRGNKRVCRESRSWIQILRDTIGNASLLWLVGISVLIALAVCGFVYRHRIQDWVRRDRTSSSTYSQNTSPPSTPPGGGNGAFPDSFPGTWKSGLEEILKLQLTSLQSTLQDVRDLLIQVRKHQGQSPAGTGASTSAHDTSEDEGQAEPSSPYGSLQAQLGSTLTDLVSRWWAEGANRDRLDDLILRDSSIKSYRSSNVQNSMKSTTNRTFLFQPIEGLAEWLGHTQQGELLLVPGDPKLFQTGDSLKFLGVLFEGLGSSLSDVRFRRVLKACRLKKEPGFPDCYRLTQRGILELEGGRAAEAFTASRAPVRAVQPTPDAQPLLVKAELAQLVQQAVERAVPGGLPNQIQDLSRQVQALAQSGVRQGSKPQRPDTDLTAVLCAVDKDLSALGQRINVIENMARVVESLRESLERIEGELLNVRVQQPLQTPPVPAIPSAALPNVEVMDLPAESRVDESWKELEDVNPESVAPSYPLPVFGPDSSEAPEQLWARLQTWWPRRLNGKIPDGYYAGDPSAAYLWSLSEVRRALSKASSDRGWQVEVVHVKVPDNSPAGERILQIHEPRSIEEQRVVCSCAPTNPFTGALLFQFALRVRGDQGQDVAVLPAWGLRLTGSTEGYARLAGGKLPENATSLAEILRPAILSQSGLGDLYTVVLPMQGKFQ